MPRARAEEVAGDRFSAEATAFHDLVPGGGPLPMAVLADVVDEWCDSVLSGSPTPGGVISSG